MVRIRALAWLASALTVVALALCWLVPAGGTYAGPKADARLETDSLVPADAGFIVTINVRQILDTPLVKKDSQTAVNAALAKNQQLAKLLKEANLDPMKDIDSVTITGTIDLTNPRGFGVVRGRFHPEKILAVAAERAKEQPDKLKVVKEGDLEMVQIQSEKPLFAAFADARTLIVSLDKASTAEAVQKAGKAPGRLNKDIQGALSKLSGNEAVAVAVVVTDQIKKAVAGQNKDAAELVSSLQCITGGVELKDALRIAVVIHTTDEAGAALVRKKIEEFLPILNLLAPQDDKGKVIKEAIDAIKVSNDKRSVTISMQVTEDMIKKAAPKDK